ncbi:hypothetical protein XELAEV_18032023mg [Xenopus laevis]|uniref:PLAT domain-containing protein n=1 Tax=Xenopus laevis TaxID=8355 RepID=A0A974HG92_XENLA|nr:hypothetical protein XELAEV_18032023mg [Xenopus laevis]
MATKRVKNLRNVDFDAANFCGKFTNLFAEGDWKITIVTGNCHGAGTDSTVILYVYGEKAESGPIILGSGKDQLFGKNSADTFQKNRSIDGLKSFELNDSKDLIIQSNKRIVVNPGAELPGEQGMNLKNLGKMYKIRIGHDNSGEDPEWYLEECRTVGVAHECQDGFESCSSTVSETGSLHLIHPYSRRAFLCEGNEDNSQAKIPGLENCANATLFAKMYFTREGPHRLPNNFLIKGISFDRRKDLIERVFLRSFDRRNIAKFDIRSRSISIRQSNIEGKSAPSEVRQTVVKLGEEKIHTLVNVPLKRPIDAMILLAERPISGKPDRSFEIIVRHEFAAILCVSRFHNFDAGTHFEKKQSFEKFSPFPRNSLEIRKFGAETGQIHPSLITINTRKQQIREKGPVDTARMKKLSELLLDYEIHVYTGAITNAGTKSNVYINLFGKRGDSGKRKLHKSLNQKVRFQKGQVDIFCIQAISLGTLGKIQISQDGTGQGNGWFLEKVFVRYKEDGIKQEIYFPCNRWLNQYKEDGTSEIELLPAEKEYPEENVSKGMRWNVQVETAKDSSQIKEMKVILVIYGTQGKSEDILLSPQKQAAKCFLPDTTDEFIVDSADVGEVYKIRITCNNIPVSSEWHLTSLYMAESKSQQDLKFICHSWFSVDHEGNETVKEFPAVNKGLEPLPVYPYVVSIHIGDHWGAETDANVHVTLYGEKGDTGKRKLHKSLMPGNMFTRSKTDSFLLEAVSLGKLRKVVLEHDGEGYGAGMYLKMVTVKESQDSSSEWVFPFWNWLDSHIATCQIACKLHTIAQIQGSQFTAAIFRVFSNLRSANRRNLPVRNNCTCTEIDENCRSTGRGHKDPEDGCRELQSLNLNQGVRRRLSRNPEPYPKSGGLWVIDISGSEYSSSESPANFTLVFSGDKGKQKLKSKITGNVIQIKEDLKSVGSIYKVQVCWSNLKLKQAWHLMSIHMKHTTSNQEMWLHWDCWMKPNEDNCVELPAMFSIRDPMPVMEYVLYIHTGDVKNAGVTGKVTICIEGENGDTGRRILNVDGNDLLSFTKGQVDIFHIKAVHLGKLHKIMVGFSSPKKDQWLLEKIIVKDGEFSSASYMFYHNEWIVCKSDREFTDTVISLKEMNTNEIKVKSFSTTTKGKWELKVLGIATGEEKEELYIVVFGKEGKSPKQKVKKLNYEPFWLHVEGIGEIIKISFLNKTGRDIQLLKVRLRDMDTKQEIGFYPKHLSHKDGIESVTELAAIFPNIPPLTDVSYSVNIKTGNLPASGTEADVFITIFGDNGDTCKRKLTPLSYPGVLAKGQVNVYEIKAVELGMLTKVHIEHKAVGYGAGWFLDHITIEDSQNQRPKYVFPCQQWLDSGIGDKQTSRELKLLGKVNKTTERLHEGTVDIFVNASDITDGSEKCAVFLTICCEKGSYDPVVFARGSLKQGATMQSSVNLSRNLGAIHKVRLQMEDGARGESWCCKEVLLQHKQTKNRLEFPFCQHFTSDGNNLVAELPALFSDGPISTVKTYTVFLTTAQSSKKTTDASLFITLHGNLGDSGKRKFFFKGNVSGKQQGIGFQLEAVDLGVIQEITIEQEKQTKFQLEKVVVEEEQFMKKSYIFIAQQWKHKDKMMSMTLQVTETIESNNSSAMLNGSNRMASDGEWNISLNEFKKEEHTEMAEYNIVILLYGEKGKSQPFIIKRKEGSQVKGILSYKLHLEYDLGLLYKVRLGLENEKDKGTLSFFYFKMQHTETLDTFIYSNTSHPFPFDQDRWIEFPVEWPLQSSLSVVKYTVAVFSTDGLSWRDGSYMSVCLHGKNGDTGDRRLTWHNSQGTKDEALTATLDAVDLGEMHHADISMSSKNDHQIHIQKIHVKESLRNNLYIFEVNSDFRISRNKGEIRKEVLVSQVILDKNADFNQEKPFIPDQKKDIEEKQEEHLVKVYTGEARGAGTDANVQIVLIGDQCSSESVQLIHPLEQQNPFERGKVDTFKIATKALGRIQSIEIGHNGKGFGSGWFLDKVEIINIATNEKIIFMCNRWLAEDENDGRTRITLYP